MRAWTLDALAIVVGVCVAEIIIQLYITPTIAKRQSSSNASAADGGDCLPF